MNRSITLVVILLCPFWLCADTTSSIGGQVTDSEGAVIANARLLVHWDSSGSTVGLRVNVGIKHDVIVVTIPTVNIRQEFRQAFMTYSSLRWHLRQPPQRCG
jgi:hypothetical protein